MFFSLRVYSFILSSGIALRTDDDLGVKITRNSIMNRMKRTNSVINTKTSFSKQISKTTKKTKEEQKVATIKIKSVSFGNGKHMVRVPTLLVLVRFDVLLDNVECSSLLTVVL